MSSAFAQNRARPCRRRGDAAAAFGLSPRAAAPSPPGSPSLRRGLALAVQLARLRESSRSTAATLAADGPLGSKTEASHMSTIALASRVLLLDEGRVVASGSHEDLLSRVPLYSEILAQTTPAEED